MLGMKQGQMEDTVFISHNSCKPHIKHEEAMLENDAFQTCLKLYRQLG